MFNVIRSFSLLPGYSMPHFTNATAVENTIWNFACNSNISLRIDFIVKYIHCGEPFHIGLNRTAVKHFAMTFVKCAVLVVFFPFFSFTFYIIFFHPLVMT